MLLPRYAVRVFLCQGIELTAQAIELAYFLVDVEQGIVNGSHKAQEYAHIGGVHRGPSILHELLCDNLAGSA